MQKITRQQLKNFRSIPHRLKQLEDKVLQYREAAEKTTTTLSDDNVGSPSGISDKVGDNAVLIISCEEKIIELKQEMHEMEKFLIDLSDEDTQLSVILHKLYIDGIKQYKISQQLSISESNIIKILNEYFGENTEK